MKRVLCFGTFDILHLGHIYFLEHAARYGDELIVVVSQDKRSATLRGGIVPIHTQKERMALLSALACVDRAVAGHKTNLLFQLNKYKPSVVVLGHDQLFGVDLLQAWTKKQTYKPKIVRLRAHKRARYATSRIKAFVCK